MKNQGVGAWYALVFGVSLTAAGGSLAGEAEGRIPTPTNLHECLEECEYRHGRDIEACTRKRDPAKREVCYAEANERRAGCRRACEKKYPKE